MNFTKIQPEQIQLPTFFSDSGDFMLSDLSTGFKIELNRSLSGNFDFLGQLHVNGSTPLFINDTVFYNTGDGSMVIGGNNNVVSGNFNIVCGGSGNVLYGSSNTVLYGVDSIFDSGCLYNTLICGNSVNFVSGATGSAFIGDNVSAYTVNQNNVLIIDFASGQRFLKKSLFEADVDVTGNLLISGNSVPRFLDVTGTSGAGALIQVDGVTTSGSGVLFFKVGNKTISVTGSYA